MNTLPIVLAIPAERSLRGRFCPGCRGVKRSMETFCHRCYFKLPFAEQRDLYKKVGLGYEGAVSIALQTLGQTDLVVPPSF